MRLLSPLALAAALTWASSAHAVDLSFGQPVRAKEETPQEPKPPPGELATPEQSGPVKIEIHGSASFWYYQPIKPSSIVGQPQSNLELYLASLEFTGRLGEFGLYLNPRFRDSEAREFFTSNVWVEEAYAFWQRPYVSIKAGKLYQQFSRIWDDTFYGSLPYFDGFKLDADYGISIDGFVETETGFSIGYFGQYFLLDGGTNGSLRHRDTVWVGDGVHRNHTAVLRVEPAYRWNEKTSLRIGLAGEYTYVDFKDIRPAHVLRFSGDVSFAVSPVRIFGEFIMQNGQSVTDYPIPRPAGAMPGEVGQASIHNYYALAGAEVQIGPVLARYSFSLARYDDIPVTEILNVPGVTIAVHDNVSLMLEYAFWSRNDPGDVSSTLDNSFNTIINGRF